MFWYRALWLSFCFPVLSSSICPICLFMYSQSMNFSSKFNPESLLLFCFCCRLFSSLSYINLWFACHGQSAEWVEQQLNTCKNERKILMNLPSETFFLSSKIRRIDVGIVVVVVFIFCQLTKTNLLSYWMPSMWKWNIMIYCLLWWCSLSATSRRKCILFHCIQNLQKKTQKWFLLAAWTVFAVIRMCVLVPFASSPHQYIHVLAEKNVYMQQKVKSSSLLSCEHFRPCMEHI